MVWIKTNKNLGKPGAKLQHQTWICYYPVPGHRRDPENTERNDKAKGFYIAPGDQESPRGQPFCQREKQIAKALTYSLSRGEPNPKAFTS